MMMIESMEDVEEFVNFADNQGMVAHMENGLQKIMDALSKTGKEYNLKINFKRNKVMSLHESNKKEVIQSTYR